MESLKITDEQSAAVAVAPRVSLDDINSAIAEVHFCTADIIAPNSTFDTGILTICLIVMRNGFMVIGKSAPASSANFNRDLGKKFAQEDAVRQLWPLMGFALRDKLAQNMEKPLVTTDDDIPF